MRSLFAEINQAVKKLRAEGSNFNSPLPNVVTAYLSKETAKKADDAIDNQQVREQQNILSSVSSQLIHHQQLTKPQSFEFTDRYTQLNHLTDTFDDSEDYLQNSGLVLLYPFLNRFFIRLNLCQAKHFINFDSTKRAVLILQYLVGLVKLPNIYFL